MLVLMRPDYAGHGSFGLKCLEEYEGEYLVLVGEWEVKKTKSQAHLLCCTKILLAVCVYFCAVCRTKVQILIPSLLVQKVQILTPEDLGANVWGIYARAVCAWPIFFARISASSSSGVRRRVCAKAAELAAVFGLFDGLETEIA